MTGSQHRNDDATAAVALAALATIAAGAALVIIRGHVHNSVTALILAAVVCTCGALGGWKAGITSAIAAAVSFNFFHTQPYLSLRIHDADDIWTTMTLLVVGAVAGVTATIGRRRHEEETSTHGEVSAIERIANLVATGAEAEDVELAVRAELLGLLSLGAVSYDAAPQSVSHLGRHGEATHADRVYHHGGFELPAQGVAIPVLRRGEAIGYLNCTPLPGTSVPDGRRRAAIAIADLLGAALTINPAPPATRRN